MVAKYYSEFSEIRAKQPTHIAWTALEESGCRRGAGSHGCVPFILRILVITCHEERDECAYFCLPLTLVGFDALVALGLGFISGVLPHSEVLYNVI